MARKTQISKDVILQKGLELLIRDGYSFDMHRLAFVVSKSDDNFIFEQSEYPVPVLNVYSDASWEHLREWKQYEENARLLVVLILSVFNFYF